jgi:hypothetical protein
MSTYELTVDNGEQEVRHNFDTRKEALAYFRKVAKDKKTYSAKLLWWHESGYYVVRIYGDIK